MIYLSQIATPSLENFLWMEINSCKTPTSGYIGCRAVHIYKPIQREYKKHAHTFYNAGEGVVVAVQMV